MNADSAANSTNIKQVGYNLQRLSVDEDKETPVATTEAVPRVAQPNDVDAFEDDADFLTFETMNDLLETLQIKQDKDAIRTMERTYNATFHDNVFHLSRGARPLAPTTSEGEERSRMEVVRSTGRRQQDIPSIQRQPVTPVDRPPHSTSSQLPRPPTTTVDKAKKRGRVGSDVAAPSPNQPPAPKGRKKLEYDDMLAWTNIHDMAIKAINDGGEPPNPNNNDFWSFMVTISKSPEPTKDHWRSHYHTKMRHNLHQMELPKTTLIVLYQQLKLPITEAIKKSLEKKLGGIVTLQPFTKGGKTWQVMEDWPRTGDATADDSH